MALLTVQALSPAGIVPTYAAVSASDTFVPNKGRFLAVVNGNAASTTVTFDSVTPSNYGTDSDTVVTVAAGTTRWIYLGDEQAQRYASPSTGVATVTFSVTASVTAGVFQI